MKRSPLPDFKLSFASQPANDLSQKFSDYACVALILKPVNNSWAIAFIRRAHNPKDPWSGQIAFPGGRKDSPEETDLDAALREVYEEVGWQLTAQNHLGFLADIQARNRQGLAAFFLRPLVFMVPQEMKGTIDPEEVDEVFWIPLEHLCDSNQATEFHWQQGNMQVSLPGIKLPTGDTLWGLTYHIFLDFINTLQKDLKA